MTIQVSSSAEEQIQKLKGMENLGPDAFLRVQVVGGGCSGLSYKMKFDTQVTDQDKVVDTGKVRIVTDGKSLMYIAGTELDFSGGLNGKGFVFNNPNAKKNCGCGSSFAV